MSFLYFFILQIFDKSFIMFVYLVSLNYPFAQFNLYFILLLVKPSQLQTVMCFLTWNDTKGRTCKCLFYAQKLQVQ